MTLLVANAIIGRIMSKKIAISVHLATDHAGLAMKNAVKAALVRDGYHVYDFGAYAADPADDYPDFVLPAAEAVAFSRGAFGIVFGGSGNGECMVANKVRGIRAALCHDAYTAKMSRAHNDANVLCLGARTMTAKKAVALARLWLSTTFSGDKRHARRIAKISRYEGR